MVKVAIQRLSIFPAHFDISEHRHIIFENKQVSKSGSIQRRYVQRRSYRSILARAGPTHHQGIFKTPPSSPLPGRPQTTSALGFSSLTNLITILNNVLLLVSIALVGSSSQQIACGALNPSENTLFLNSSASTFFPLLANSSVNCWILASRIGLPLSHGGSST